MAKSEETNDFKMILQKRKQEEAKNPNAKCKVVIKDTVTVGEAKSSSMTSSQQLLVKVNINNLFTKIF